MNEMDTVRAKLVEKFESSQPFEFYELERLVYLIGWTEDNPAATRADYLDEMARTRRDGPRWS